MSKSLRVRAKLLVFLAGVFPMLTIHGQAVKSDFSSMAAAGKVNGDIYQNSILGITLSAPKARWEAADQLVSPPDTSDFKYPTVTKGSAEHGPRDSLTSQPARQ